MYMAPEIEAGTPGGYQGTDIDIFAFGVMMLVLRLMAYPFDNATLHDQEFKKFYEKPNSFWKNCDRNGLASDEFKGLISLLCAPDPGARATMADLLGHPWMRGECASKDEIVEGFTPFMNKAKQQRDGSGEALDVDF